jgi:hypothetical protein
MVGITWSERGKTGSVNEWIKLLFPADHSSHRKEQRRGEIIITLHQ